MSTITIERDGEPLAAWTMAGDHLASRELWLLLVNYLRPGLTVGLVEGNRRLVEESGAQLTADQYAEVMGAPAPSAGGEGGHE